MHRRELWRVAKEVLRLGLVVLIVSPTVTSLLLAPSAPVAEASVAADKSDDKDKKDQKEKDQQDDDRGDDFVLNGQVLEIDTSKDPPEMVVGTVDGRAVVRVLKTDEIAINGVGVGDYVELTGEKINELLFEATQISVGQRFAGSESDPSADDEDAEDDEESDEDEPEGDDSDEAEDVD